ncbi:40S ribosomal protein SA-like [Herpailurus yagouaroundi]|uniref:40S ribosomal protein SA-like n=1 Tax=Herpailurus yagouaroundi TaxID=1608482 RepID=UPI001AD7B56E|nr:40S ribosomal protein SA-like [Puma yagouaroundi]
MRGSRAGSFCNCVLQISREHRREITPDPYFCRRLGEIEKEEPAAAAKTVTEEEGRVGGLLQFPRFLLLNLRLQTGLKAYNFGDEKIF